MTDLHLCWSQANEKTKLVNNHSIVAGIAAVDVKKSVRIVLRNNVISDWSTEQMRPMRKALLATTKPFRQDITELNQIQHNQTERDNR